jgi:hypothetical protein
LPSDATKQALAELQYVPEKGKERFCLGYNEWLVFITG